MLKQFYAALAGGLMISIGGAVYLNSCLSMNTEQAKIGSVVGAFFFSVALICICLKGYGLFTGKVGYLAESHTGRDVAAVGMTLLGNAVATLLLGVMISGGKTGNIGMLSASLMMTKFQVPWYITLLRAILCGVLMYLAVSIYRERGTVVGILMCVPAFILAGFEHSIADLFYYGAALLPLWEYDAQMKTSLVASGLWFLPLVVIGNSVGGMLLPALARLMREADPEEAEPVEDAEDAEEVDA